MLVLTRRKNDRVKVYCRGVEIWVTLIAARPGEAKLGFDAPAEVQIVREEVEMRVKPTGVPQ